MRWTEMALVELASLRDYIGHDSPVMPRLVVTRFCESVSLLVDNPDTVVLVDTVAGCFGECAAP